jgi:hypothetical protein
MQSCEHVGGSEFKLNKLLSDEQVIRILKFQKTCEDAVSRVQIIRGLSGHEQDKVDIKAYVAELGLLDRCLEQRVILPVAAISGEHACKLLGEHRIFQDSTSSENMVQK